MRIKRSFSVNGKTIETTYTHVPFRYILAMLITVLEIAVIIGIVVLLCYYVPYFYLAALCTQVACVIMIISSDDNPDYKAPWLLCVMILPVAGFMLYFMFYKRNINKKYSRRFKNVTDRYSYAESDDNLAALELLDADAVAQARLITRVSGAHVYRACECEYLSLGERMRERLLEDLKNAESFIFMEYFIIEDGLFWGSILEILKQKAKEGIDVRVVFDDIGCMLTLPGNYAKTLRSYGIKAVQFSMLKGQADGEFNNRSHRKITVIDGNVGYTGGINLADEYINERSRFGHWKDTGLRFTGPAVNELTRLFFADYYINSKEKIGDLTHLMHNAHAEAENGYVIPFSDGPRPLYSRQISKLAIQGLLAGAREYVYITTPYLIIDNELCASIESCALRGVDVRILLPHTPDKKLIFEITKSFYSRLIDAGVRIYEYTPGFVHSKLYVADGKTAIIGTMNLDYRSLVHHFENGVWLYGCECINDMVEDIRKTLEMSGEIKEPEKVGIILRLIRSVGRIFAPLM